MATPLKTDVVAIGESTTVAAVGLSLLLCPSSAPIEKREEEKVSLLTLRRLARKEGGR